MVALTNNSGWRPNPSMNDADLMAGAYALYAQNLAAIGAIDKANLIGQIQTFFGSNASQERASSASAVSSNVDKSNGMDGGSDRSVSDDGVRPACRFCGKTFAQASYIKAHERLHTGTCMTLYVWLQGSNMVFRALTFTRSRGRCWKPMLEAAVFNTSLGTWWMLMHWKTMYDCYYCIKTENICYIWCYFLHFCFAFSLMSCDRNFHGLCSF